MLSDSEFERYVRDHPDVDEALLSEEQSDAFVSKMWEGKKSKTKDQLKADGKERQGNRNTQTLIKKQKAFKGKVTSMIAGIFKQSRDGFDRVNTETVDFLCSVEEQMKEVHRVASEKETKLHKLYKEREGQIKAGESAQLFKTYFSLYESEREAFDKWCALSGHKNPLSK